MKKRIPVLLCCGMLAAAGGNLTGCMPVDAYETEHIRFSAPYGWELIRAEYNEWSKATDTLRFETDHLALNLYEDPLAKPLDSTAEEYGWTVQELTGYKYPAWEEVWSYKAPNGETEIDEVRILVDAGGYMLRIDGTVAHGYYPISLSYIEPDLPALLDSIELTCEPKTQPEPDSGEADTTALHVAWSPDWKIYESYSENAERELALCLSQPETDADRQTLLTVHDMGAANAAQHEIETILEQYQKDSELAERSAELLTGKNDTRLCGVSFDQMLRQVLTFKNDGHSLIYRNYYLAYQGNYYAVCLTCDGSAEAHMNEMLNGITLIAKE